MPDKSMPLNDFVLAQTPDTNFEKLILNRRYRAKLSGAVDALYELLNQTKGGSPEYVKIAVAIETIRELHAVIQPDAKEEAAHEALIAHNFAVLSAGRPMEELVDEADLWRFGYQEFGA